MQYHIKQKHHTAKKELCIHNIKNFSSKCSFCYNNYNLEEHFRIQLKPHHTSFLGTKMQRHTWFSEIMQPAYFSVRNLKHVTHSYQALIWQTNCIYRSDGEKQLSLQVTIN